MSRPMLMYMLTRKFIELILIFHPDRKIFLVSSLSLITHLLIVYNMNI